MSRKSSKNAPVVVDPLDTAVNQSKGAVALFTDVLYELADANDVLDDVAIEAQNAIEAATARLKTATAQRAANVGLASRIDALVSPAS